MRWVAGTRWWFLAMLVGALALATRCMVRVPGHSFEGTPPEVTAMERELAQSLFVHVDELAGKIGERNTRRPEALARARDYVAAELAATGLGVERQGFDADGTRCENLLVEVPGRSQASEIVVVGAHYDSAEYCPAANDNGSGVAALVELAQRFAREPLDRTLRFVAFVNEEPPRYETEAMRSLVYARACRACGDVVVAMLSQETMGNFRCREPDPASGTEAVSRRV